MSTGRVVALLIAVAVVAYFAASFGANRKQDNTATDSDPPYTRPYTAPYVAPYSAPSNPRNLVQTSVDAGRPNTLQPSWLEQHEQERRAKDQEQRLREAERQSCQALQLAAANRDPNAPYDAFAPRAPLYCP